MTKTGPGELSAAEYARKRGVSRTQVSDEIKAGQIPPEAVRREGRRIFVNVEIADRHLATVKDYTRASADQIERAEEGEDVPPIEGYYSLKNELAREKHWKANLAEMEFRIKSGELIPAEEVEEKYTAAVTAARTKLLGISRRVQQRMPHIAAKDVKEIHDLVKEALEDLSHGG